MEAIEIPVGPFVFDARAAGPPDGVPVILLHGFPQTSWSFRHQIQALGDAGYRAVAPDQRGYSPRARPAEVDAYANESVMADVLGIAGELGFERFHVVGHDFGGVVVWQLGGRHPDRLLSLTSVSTPHPAAFTAARRGGGDQGERSTYMDFFQTPEAESFFLDDDAAVLRGIFAEDGVVDAAPEYVRVLTQPGALTAALNWYRAGDVGHTRGLGPIVSPTMYVWSTDDVALGREAAEATAAQVDGPYRFEVLEGVSHWVPEVAPDALNALLLDHLRPAGSGPAPA
jgi:pimeloyl-ACP methyl ester carboxylesterase